MKANPKNRRNTPANSPETENVQAQADKAPAPQPVNISDGIPDRVENPTRWRLILVLLVFACWAGFLIYCLLTGRLENGAM